MVYPKVSIIIPTHNHAKFLPKAIDSLISQTMEEWEVIIVNHFSDDNTVDVVKSYSDTRIKLVNCLSGQGSIAAARNFGLTFARATIIAFLDSDDFWYPEKLSACLSKLSRGYDLVCHAEIWAGPGDRRRVARYGPEVCASYKNLLFEGNCISTSAVVMLRECLDRVGIFNERMDFNTAEDYDLWLRMSRDGVRIGFVNEVLGEYLIHESNSSKNNLRNMIAVRAVFEDHVATFSDEISKACLKRRRALILYSGARELQNNGQHWEALRIFYDAVCCYPLVPKFYVAILLNSLGLRL